MTQTLTSNQREYQNNADEYKRRARKSYAKTFETRESRLHRMIVEARSRAKGRGLPFEIEDEDVVWNDICPVLGIPIHYEERKGRGGDDNSPSLDRIENVLGYVKGNVRLISNRANKLKNRMTKDEALLIWKNWDRTSIAVS